DPDRAPVDRPSGPYFDCPWHRSDVPSYLGSHCHTLLPHDELIARAAKVLAIEVPGFRSCIQGRSQGGAYGPTVTVTVWMPLLAYPRRFHSAASGWVRPRRSVARALSTYVPGVAFQLACHRCQAYGASGAARLVGC